MQCEHCGDPVCFRDEREGIIHKNGRYACRVRQPGGQYTAASVGAEQEKRLRVAASVKLPEEPPKATVRRGRKHEEWTE